MVKSRKSHPIVQVAYRAATELNDILNAIGLRISLLRRQPEPATSSAEMARLAGLVEKASERVQRLQEYARAEELVASMRPARAGRRAHIAGRKNSAEISEPRQRTALLITDAPFENNSIKAGLEQSGFHVVSADSSTNALKLLQSSDDFDHIVCDSSILAEAGWNFTSKLSTAAPASRIYVLHRRDRDLDHDE